MCGIVAVSATVDVQDEVVAALSRVQYRGYDSFGFAWVTASGHLDSTRSTEADAVQETCLPLCRTVLGHTRWATHGAVNLQNCHPHMSQSGNFALVHNGIVTNFDALCSGQKATQSDSKLIVGLLEQQLADGLSRLAALKAVSDKLLGRNSMVVLFDDGEILACREGSPLVVGKTLSGDLYLASDQLAFSAGCEQMTRIADGEFVRIRGELLEIYSKALSPRTVGWQPVTERYQATDKSDYKHFMQKEIMEQWQTLPRVLQLCQTESFAAAIERIRQANRVIVTGAGGAYFTARQIAWQLRNLTTIDAIAVPAYEYSAFSSLLTEDDVLIAVSQSGETADTLQAIQTAKTDSVGVISIINVPGSSMQAVSDISLQQSSGPEVCVLSTKSATAQMTVGFLLAKALARETKSAIKHVQTVSHDLVATLSSEYLAKCKRIAALLANHSSIYVLGRHDLYAIAELAALNIKEASYIHAEAFSAGELKHGVLALVTEGVPVVVYVGAEDVFMRQVISEVKARGAFVVGVLADQTCEGVCDEWVRLPAGGSPIAAAVPGQLLAYFAATALARNPDRPRNLAKSITVL